MKKLRKISRKYYLRQIVICWMVYSLLFFIPVRIASAAPHGGEFMVGGGAPGAYIHDGIPDSEVKVGQMKSIIHWDSLDTFGGEKLTFLQNEGLNNAAVLNRVVGDGTMSPTQFDGALNGQNMRIFMVNPAGIVFGSTACINVSQLVASSLSIANEDFLNGIYKFTGGVSAGDVINYATDITADRLALIGRNVINRGALVANNYVVMAAGDTVLLSENGTVSVEVTMGDYWVPGSSFYKVSNEDGRIEVTGETAQVVLAAGDVWSAALVKAYSGGGSDAVATVDISAAGNVCITNDVVAEAAGSGDDAIAKVKIGAGGDIEVRPDSHCDAAVRAIAHDGVNNTADILVEADGDIKVKAEDGSQAEIEAIAKHGMNNLATVDVEAGGDVKVITEGWGSGPVSEAEIMALAKDSVTNTANIKVVAGGDVKVIGIDGGQAQIEAIAKEAEISNTANIDITTEDGDVKVLGIGGAYTEGFTPSEALIGATAESAGEEGMPGSSNSANITIVAKDIVEAVSVDTIIKSSEEDGEKDGDVLVLGVDGGKAEIEAKAMYGSDNSAGVDITADGDVKVKAEGYESEEYDSTVSEAEIMALAKEGVTNTADIGVVAGGDVVVLSKDGGQAQMEAIAKYADSTNTASIDITAEDGYVLVHGIGGYYSYDEYQNSSFTPSEALIGATAEYAGEEGGSDGSNSANITIVAKDIVEEVSEDTIIKSSEEDGEKDGDVMVIGVDGGKAEIEAIAKESSDNSADVDITADGDVKVIAKCEGQNSQAEITALAKNAITNTADVGIVAGGDVKVIAECGGEAGIEAKAKNDGYIYVEPGLMEDGYVNSANIGITAANVEVKGERGGEAVIEAIADNEVGIGNGQETGDITVGSVTNTATVDITAVGCDGEGGEVLVMAEKDGEADIDAEAFNEVYLGYSVGLVALDGELPYENLTVEGPVENKAAVSIDAADDVKVIAKYSGNADIDAEARNEVGNEGSYLNVIVDGTVANNAETRNDAYYEDLSGGVGNTSKIAINTGGDVLVLGDNGEASIEAIAEESSDNTATILINAVGGDVKVIDIGEVGDTAKIVARAEEAFNSNTADVTINATATTSEYEEEGKVYVEVEGGDVKVIGKDGGKAEITAFAADSEGPQTNTANVTIHATAAEGTRPELVKEAVYDGDVLIEPAVYEAVPYTDGGDVKVIAEYSGDAEIEAIAKDGYTNTANVLICIDGGVKVKGENYGKAEIEAIAKGYDSINTASVGIGAKGEDGVEVRAEYDGEASIGSKAKDGYMNTARTIVCTQGGVQVIDMGGYLYGETAKITAEALDGDITNAYVGICAVDDVIVNASTYYVGDGLQLNGYDSMGGHAMIKAEAGAMQVPSVSLDVQQPLPVPDDQEPSTANAQVVVVSHKGNVEVTASNGGTAEILAEAYDAHTNNADVGVAAGADLSPSDVALSEEPIGNVLVTAYGEGSKAQILAWAHDASPIYVPGEVEEQPVIVPGGNNAKTVICAPGEVLVFADQGSDAKIKSWAGGWREEDSINTATTQVYASEVKVDVPDRRGNGISAWAVGSELINVPDNSYNEESDDGRLTYCLGDDGTVAITDGTSTLTVDTYSNRKGCPTCPPCPCEKEKVVPPVEVVPPPPVVEEKVFAPVAPLPQVSIPRIEGCPGLMLATASELGIAGETLQVAMGNALALNPSIQPCGASATLLNSARILRDEDGSRMAAINQVFNSLAPANAPMTPEMEASIAMAFAENGAEGSQYALAKEYIDAFVQYAAVLDVQLGSPVGDSTVFVMTKYGAGITESNNRNMAAFVMSRMESAGTLSK